MNQQNTYNIYGGNAQEIGQEVSRRQLDANAVVLRTTKLEQDDGYSFYSLSAAEQADRADSPQCCYFRKA